MSTSLKSLFGMLVAGVALSLAILAMLPGMAEAQETASVYNTQTANQNADATSAQPDPSDYRLVVYPGDTLWAISQRRLGPDATPPQVGGEVGRILELNHDWLAGNPDLIFPGQELLLPAPEPALPEPALSEPVPIHNGEADEGSVVPPTAPAAPQAGEVVPSAGSLQEHDQEAYDEGWRWTTEEPVASDAPQEGEAAPLAEPSQEEEELQQQQQEDQEIYDDDGQTLIARLLIGLLMLAITLGGVAILVAVIAPSKRGAAQEQQTAPERARRVPYEEPSSILSNRPQEYLPEEQNSPKISSTVPPDAVAVARSKEEASLAVAPNPVPPEVEVTTLIWSTGNKPAGQVYLSVDDGPEEFIAEGVDGYAQAVEIQPNVTYEFRLYAGTERTVPLDSVTVTRSEEALPSEASDPAARRAR